MSIFEIFHFYFLEKEGDLSVLFDDKMIECNRNITIIYEQLCSYIIYLNMQNKSNVILSNVTNKYIKRKYI
jgi:hypothetical protein